MTVLDDRRVSTYGPACRTAVVTANRVPVRTGNGSRPTRMRSAQRPVPARPSAGVVRYSGSGVAVSRAPHGRSAVSTSVALVLAAGAALITLWLGCLAQFGGGGSPAASAAVPEHLGVVQVQAGETLQELARRVAPDVPAVTVVQRILDLNDLESPAVDAGQTLIAPLG